MNKDIVVKIKIEVNDNPKREIIYHVTQTHDLDYEVHEIAKEVRHHCLSELEKVVNPPIKKYPNGHLPNIFTEGENK